MIASGSTVKGNADIIESKPVSSDLLELLIPRQLKINSKDQRKNLSKDPVTFRQALIYPALDSLTHKKFRVAKRMHDRPPGSVQRDPGLYFQYRLDPKNTN